MKSIVLFWYTLFNKICKTPKLEYNKFAKQLFNGQKHGWNSDTNIGPEKSKHTGKHHLSTGSFKSTLFQNNLFCIKVYLNCSQMLSLIFIPFFDWHYLPEEGVSKLCNILFLKYRLHDKCVNWLLLLNFKTDKILPRTRAL
jgi:hypothetical protein